MSVRVLEGDEKIYRWGVVTAPFVPGREPERVGPPSSLAWVDAVASPLGVSGVDTRPYCQCALSASTSLESVEVFGELRAGRLGARRDATPEDAGDVICRLSFPLWPEPDEDRDGALSLAERMEDRWDIFEVPGRLLFCNSWSGAVELVAEHTREADGVEVRRVSFSPEVLRGPSEDTVVVSPQLAVGVVDFLVRSLILDLWVPHPVPEWLGQDAPAIGEWSWRVLGRKAYFATPL